MRKQLLAFGTCGAQGDNLTWTLTSDGVLTISGEGAMADYEDFSDALWYGKHILAVVLADGVTSIGNHAFFDCKELVLVTIPDSVISIGAGAFAGCKSLTTFFVSAGNPAYGLLDGVLFDKAQTTLVAYPSGRQGSSYAIPDGVTSIGDYAFCRC